MINRELRDTTAKRSPIAVVGVDDLTDEAHTPDDAIDRVLRALKKEFLSKTPGILCNHPSITVSYVALDEPRGVATLRAVSGKFGGRMYVVTVATVSTQPYNETYLADQQAILDGFTVVFAGKY